MVSLDGLWKMGEMLSLWEQETLHILMQGCKIKGIKGNMMQQEL